MAELPSWVASRLIAQGHEPSDYDYDEASKTVSKKLALGQQPNITEPAGDVETPKPQVTSKLGAFGANFATGVAPTAAGVGTGALAMTGLAAAGIAAPYITIPVALLAGLGGAYGAGKAQEKVLSKVAPQVNEYVEQANIEHPWPSIAGNLFSAGPFFETDIQALRSVPRLAKNLVRGTKNDPRDLANAANIAINTGVGGGQSLYDELQKPSEERNYLRPFVNAAGAAVLNNPRPWMGRFGFNRNEYAPEAPGIRDIVEGARNAQVEDIAGIRSKQNVQPDINQAGVVEQSLANRYNMEKLAEVPAGEAKSTDWKNASLDQLAIEDPVLAEARQLKAETDKQNAILAARKQAYKEAKKATKLLSKQRTEEIAAYQELNASELTNLSDYADVAIKQAQERGASHEEIQAIQDHYTGLQKESAKQLLTRPEHEQVPQGDQFVLGNELLKRPVVQSKEDVIPVTSSDLLKQKAIAQDVAKAKQTIAQAPVKTPTTETPILGPIKTAPIIEQPLVQGTERPNAPRETKRYQPESNITEDSLKNQLHNAIKTGALPPRLTQALHPIMQKLGLWRNVDIQANPELAGAGAVSGLREGYNTLKAEVNLNKAGADTHAHELAHGMLEDMAVRGNPRDKYLVRKTFEAAEKSPEYQQWLAEEATRKQRALHNETALYAKELGLNAGVDEFLAHRAGREFVKRLIAEATGDKSGKMSWPKEMFSTIKARLGRGSLDDYLRILTNRVISDPEFHAAYRGEGINPVGSSVREQPSSQFKNGEWFNREGGWRTYIDEGPKNWEAGSNDTTRIDEGKVDPKELLKLPGNFNEDKLFIKNKGGRYNDSEWEAFKKLLAAGTIRPNITVDVSKEGKASIYEGNHRLRAAAELNQPVNVQVRYLGNSQRKGLLPFTESNIRNQPKSDLQSPFSKMREAVNKEPQQEQTELPLQEPSKFHQYLRENAPEFSGEQMPQREQPNSRFNEEELKKLPEMYMEASAILRDSKKLGYKSETPVSSESLVNRLHNTITPIEKDILDRAGFKDYVKNNPNVSANDMAKWIDENANPSVTVENYGQEGKVSKHKQEFDAMQHEWYDNLMFAQRNAIDKYTANFKLTDLDKKYLSDVPKDKLEKYAQLYRTVAQETFSSSSNNSNGPRATQYYDTLSAFDKTKHPIQRVDVVLPKAGIDKNAALKRMLNEGITRNEALDTLEDSPEHSKALWQQDNLHENLPNTLGWAMIQYKDHPTLGKVAYLEEVQSRWGQKVREDLQASKAAGDKPGEGGISNTYHHPLLKDYNRLILKAAIQQAKKEGASHIVISDADSAMMTEGHDLAASSVIPADRHEVWKEFGGDSAASVFAEKAFGEDWREGKYVRIKSDYFRIDKSDNNPIPKREIAQALKDAGYGEKEGTYIPQEGGMRFNYDQLLPRIAEELTGSKGQPISLGEHKRAFVEDVVRNMQRMDAGEDIGDIAREGSHLIPRRDLIFKNPDGTPKTEATGLAYPVSGTPEKFSLTSKRYQPESSLKTEDVPNATNKEGYSATPKRNILFRPWTDVVSRLAEKQNNPTATEVADKIGKTLTDSDRLSGQFGNKLVAATRDYTPDEISRVRRVRYDVANGETPTYILTLKERALQNRINNIFKEIGLEHQKRGMMVKSGDDTFRQMQLNPAGYDPAMPSLDVVKSLVENKPEAEQYMQDFINHAKKRSISEEQAREIFNDYRQAIGNIGLTPDIRFGALRKVQGIGLPWSMVEKNFNRLALRYGNRAAHDMAFFKYLQNDPRMMKALGIKDQYGNKFEDLPLEQQKKAEDIKYLGKPEEVQDALHAIYGLDLPTSPRVMSAVRAVASAVMGPGTAARNQIQWAMTVSPYYGVNPKTMAEAIFHANDAAQRAFENNAVRAGYKDFDAAGDFEGNPDKFINYADKFVSVMRKYSGRDLSDRIEGLMSYSLGEVMATRWTAAAKIGDVKAQRMLERFGTTLDKPVKEYFKPETQLTQEDISKIAKEFTDAARGTYSAKGLPDYAIKGEMAPLFALSRWSIERANLFHKDVVKPLTQHGDIAPLLKVVFAGLMSGAAIEKLNEALTDKRAADLTIKETLANADTENVTAKLIGLAQLGSIAGIMSDSAKLGMNVYQGKDIKFSQPLSVPAMSAAENIMQNTAFASQALHSGEDPVDVLTEYMKDFVSQTFQAARYVRNNLDTKETKRKEKFRDVQVWKELQHEGKATDTGKTNPYEGLAAKKFKRTEDIGEAAEMLADLLTKAFEKAKGDPYKLKAQLRSLKSNSYQTMPNPENFPMDMARYYLHLSETQGEEEAANRLADYLSKNAVNKVKSQMVPSL